MDKQKDIQAGLAAPFENGDIEWRLQWYDNAKENGIAVPYVTNRAIQTRLDRVFGVGNWKNEFIPWHSDGKRASQLCGISAFFPERGEWVAKYDGAGDSDIEPIKGGLSDSMKRAAVQWGIGRYLYDIPTVYVRCDAKGNSAVIRKSEYAALNKEHGDFVKRVFGGTPPRTPQRDAAPPNAPPQTNAGGANTQTPPAPPRTSAESRRTANAPTGAPQRNTPSPNAAPPQAPASAEASTHRNARTNPAGAKRQTSPEALSAARKPAPATFLVLKTAELPNSKGGRDTSLLIKSSEGREFQTFLRGYDPALVPGAVLKNAKISQKLSGGVVFFILNSYETGTPAAA